MKRPAGGAFAAATALALVLLGCGQSPPSASDDATATPTATPAPEVDPMADALLRLAETKLAQMQAPQALAEVEEALELAPELARAHLLRGRILFLQVEYRKAIASFERTLQLIGQDPETLYYLGEALLQLKEYDRAERAFLDLLAIDPDYRDAVERLAILYVSTNDRDKELPALERAAKSVPDSAEVRLLLGLVLRQRGEIERSREVLERARELAPDNPRTHYELGMTLKHLGRQDEARAAFEKAVELDRLHEGASNQLMLYARKSSPEERERARARFEEAREYGKRQQALRNEIEYEPGNAQVVYQLGLLQAEHGYVEEAESIFARVLLMDPKLRPAATNLGRARMQLARPEHAIPPFQRAVELEPEVLHFRVELAQAMLDAEHPDAADVVAQVAARVAEGDASGHFQLGQLLARSGRGAEADAAFSRTIELAAELGEAYASRGLLRGKLGQREAAITDLRRALELGTGRDELLRQALTQLGAS